MASGPSGALFLKQRGKRAVCALLRAKRPSAHVECASLCTQHSKFRYLATGEVDIQARASAPCKSVVFRGASASGALENS